MVIPVVFVADDYYIPYTAVTIQSVLENADKEDEYKLFILHGGLSNEVIRPLQDMVETFKFASLRFIDISEYIKGYTFEPQGWSVAIYYKLLIPYLLPEFEKVMYLDSDTVCCTDIAELYKTDIKNHLIAGVRDIPVIGLGIQEKHSMQSKHKLSHGALEEIRNINDYINTGVLLFNTEEFNKTTSANELLDMAVHGEYKYPDQDIINIVCGEKKVILSNIWNCMSCCGVISRVLSFVPENIKQDYENTKIFPNIIHFIKKPWKEPFVFLYSDHFWKYATRTAYIDKIMGKMSEAGILFCRYTDFYDYILDNIKHREGIGLKFLLRCILQWITRDKK